MVNRATFGLIQLRFKHSDLIVPNNSKIWRSVRKHLALKSITSLFSPWPLTSSTTPFPLHHTDYLILWQTVHTTFLFLDVRWTVSPWVLRSHSDSRQLPVYTLPLAMSFWLQREDWVKWLYITWSACCKWQTPQSEIPADREKFFSLFLRGGPCCTESYVWNSQHQSKFHMESKLQNWNRSQLTVQGKQFTWCCKRQNIPLNAILKVFLRTTDLMAN